MSAECSFGYTNATGIESSTGIEVYRLSMGRRGDAHTVYEVVPAAGISMSVCPSVALSYQAPPTSSCSVSVSCLLLFQPKALKLLGMEVSVYTMAALSFGQCCSCLLSAKCPSRHGRSVKHVKTALDIKHFVCVCVCVCMLCVAYTFFGKVYATQRHTHTSLCKVYE